MSRLNLAWMLHHPLRWARHVWWQLTLATILAVKAVLVGSEIWQVTFLHTWWPPLLGAASCMIVASTIALHHRGIQTATRNFLAIVAVWRASTYLVIWYFAPAGESLRTLAGAFALHWMMIGLTAIRWDTLSVRSSLEIAVEAGERRVHERC